MPDLRPTTILTAMFALAGCHAGAQTDNGNPVIGNAAEDREGINYPPPVQNAGSLPSNQPGNAKEIRAKVGTEVAIVLGANNSVPFSWHLVPVAGIVDITSGYVPDPAPPGYVGGGGKLTYVLRVTTPGPHIVRFESRYLGPDHHVGDTAQFTVIGT